MCEAFNVTDFDYHCDIFRWCVGCGKHLMVLTLVIAVKLIVCGVITVIFLDGVGGI